MRKQGLMWFCWRHFKSTMLFCIGLIPQTKTMKRYFIGCFSTKWAGLLSGTLRHQKQISWIYYAKSLAEIVPSRCVLVCYGKFQQSGVIHELHQNNNELFIFTRWPTRKYHFDKIAKCWARICQCVGEMKWRDAATVQHRLKVSEAQLFHMHCSQSSTTHPSSLVILNLRSKR